jgi:mRNA-degrading endonuclease YafQ of YafQ-DinJ toxin-antitoxin module
MSINRDRRKHTNTKDIIMKKKREALEQEIEFLQSSVKHHILTGKLSPARAKEIYAEMRIVWADSKEVEKCNAFLDAAQAYADANSNVERLELAEGYNDGLLEFVESGE